MEFTVHGRHMEVPERLRSAAEDKVTRLARHLGGWDEAEIHFLVVMFGVLGGLAAFGLVGLFVGPVILAVLLAIWREWLLESAAAAPRA